MCWSKDDKINMEEWNRLYLWRPGTYVIEGDSNAYPINPDWISDKAFLMAFPGKIPEMCVAEFPDVLKRHLETPIEKVFIQVGGNDWTWVPLHLWDMNMTAFNTQMGKLMDLYLEILPAKDIVVVSLPYVYPKLTLQDMMKDKQADIKLLPDNIRQLICDMRLNDIMSCGNVILRTLCDRRSVQYLDIYHFLKNAWDKKGRSAFWDKIHYNQCIRKRIAGMIKTRWGIE